jgi:hypothetical protein
MAKKVKSRKSVELLQKSKESRTEFLQKAVLGDPFIKRLNETLVGAYLGMIETSMADEFAKLAAELREK